MANDIELLRSSVIEQYSQIAWEPLRTEALDHTLCVTAYCLLLARFRKLDPRLAEAAGLLHDWGKLAMNQPRSHAKYSAEFARKWLEQNSQFDPQETEMIVRAIARHSDKNRIDDPLDELLKDADLLARFVKHPEEPLDPIRRKRLQNMEKELGIQF